MPPPSDPNAGSIEIRVFVVACLGILFLIMYLGTRATRNNAYPTLSASASEHYHGAEIDYMNHPDEASARVSLLAQQVDGDWTRLNADDQHWLDNMTSGHGAAMIAMRARELKAKAKADKKRAAHKALSTSQG